MADDVRLGKAENIEFCLSRIRSEYVGHEGELESDLTRQDSIVLNLQRACQAAIDLAHHLVREHRLGLPKDSRDPFRMLEEAGRLPAEMSRRLQAMVGFRNIAVHRYQEIDMSILRSILDERLTDLTDFASHVLRGADSPGD